MRRMWEMRRVDCVVESLVWTQWIPHNEINPSHSS
jgi:hypothetical protein